MKSKSRAAELHRSPPPTVAREGDTVAISGDWTLRALKPRLVIVRAQLLFSGRIGGSWDLSGVSRLDTFGATLLWRAWGHRMPVGLTLDSRLQSAFDRVLQVDEQVLPEPAADLLQPIVSLGERVIGAARHMVEFATMVGFVAIEVGRLLIEPRNIPMREFSAALYKTGVQALPVSALVGFLVGIVLSYLSALQLRNFGADALIINILGIGIIRELGPVLVSILVAGRSGSAITAQLGVMRVTEEIDALSAMGVSRHQRLVWPKVLAMGIAMPLLVVWTSAVAIVGGMVSSHYQLDISYQHFLEMLPRVVPIQNLYIALVKGAIFGMTIALIACHFGLRIKPNTESLSRNTTASVVTAITMVILIDAVIAIATRGIGVPVR